MSLAAAASAPPGGVPRAARGSNRSLAVPIVVSGVLHVVVLGALAYRAGTDSRAMPPMYRVNIVAAPPGERAIGEVGAAPTATPTPAAAAPDRKSAPRDRAATKQAARPTRAATPNVANAPAPSKSAAPPRAAGGREGGAGADVATVSTEGVEFPFPGYLNNIVRQIALAFDPPPGTGALSADVAFLIRRDGSVASVRLVTRSGVFSFDQECLTAVEAAASGRKFGPLPAGFADDVLPVVFSFDPKRMR